MLGFDPKTLHRIGYGGGYYDKFLAGQPEAKKVGVCYEAGKTGQIPMESHDIALDMVVTENQVYSAAD
jgi:5,10-methenyltetrahydrofolate synthetase